MDNIIGKIASAINNFKKLKGDEIFSCDPAVGKISALLEGELKEIQETIFQLIHENAELKKEAQELKVRLGEGKEFEVKNSVYYSSEGDGPFCPFCYDKRGRKNRLRSDVSGKDSSVTYACRVCGGSFGE